MSETVFIGNTLFPYEEIRSGSIEECIEYLSNQHIIGLDIETSRKYPKGMYPEDVYKPGLDPYLSRIVMVQTGTLEKRYIIDARVIDISPLKQILENKNIVKVGHNLKFEGKFFLHTIGARLVNVWDVMISENVLYNGARISYSLEAMMGRYLNIKPVKEVNLFNQIDVSEIDIQLKREEYFLSGIEMDDEEIRTEIEADRLENSYIDKNIRMGFINIEDKPFTLEQLKYGEGDITAPLQIMEMQKKGREGYYPANGLFIQNKTTQVLAELELKGLHTDTGMWLKLYDKNLIVYRERLNALNNYVEENYLEFCGSINLFSSKPECAVKWNSSKEVIRFFKLLGIAPKERSKVTKRTTWTVGAKALFKILDPERKAAFFNNRDEEIKDFQSLILMYLLFKKSSMAITTFGKDWVSQYIHPVTKRAHSSYRQYMHTGRLSSTRPNLQNPPGGEYRDCFIALPGMKKVCADYSNQELRILAQVSENETIRKFYNELHPVFGDDLHSFAGTGMFQRMYKNPEFIVSKKTPKERNISKNFNFKTIFGGTAYTFSQELGITEQAAQEMLDLYFDTFPKLKDNFEYRQNLALERGWIQLDPYTGQRYFFPDFEKMKGLSEEAWSFYPDDYRRLDAESRKKVKEQINREHPEIKALWSEYFYLKGKLERKALNYPIQGNAATMMKIALILIYDWRWNNNKQEQWYPDNCIHDEVTNQAVEEHAQECSEVTEKLMVQAASFTCPDVAMRAEAVISDYWIH